MQERRSKQVKLNFGNDGTKLDKGRGEKLRRGRGQIKSKSTNPKRKPRTPKHAMLIRFKERVYMLYYRSIPSATSTLLLYKFVTFPRVHRERFRSFSCARSRSIFFIFSSYGPLYLPSLPSLSLSLPFAFSFFLFLSLCLPDRRVKTRCLNQCFTYREAGCTAKLSFLIQFGFVPA